MGNQTSMNGSTSRSDHVSPRKVVGNATDVMRDVTELIELQGKLFASDLKLTCRRAAVPTLLLTAGVCLLLGLVPVLLAGLADLFVERFDLTRSLALLASAGCGLVAAVALLLTGWLLLRNAMTQLRNSGDELQRNLRWLKHTLRSDSSKH